MHEASLSRANSAPVSKNVRTRKWAISLGSAFFAYFLFRQLCRLRSALQILLNASTFLFSLFSFSLALSVFPFSGPIKTEKSQAENYFSERKLSCTYLNFGEILFAETKRAVPNGQHRSILPARVSNQNTEFSAHALTARSWSLPYNI